MTADVVEHPSSSALRARAIDSAVEARRQWRRGFDAGRSAALATLLDEREPTFLYIALQTLAVELKLQRAAAEALGRQLDVANRGRVDALRRVIELARELDRRSPGWDR